MADIICDLDGYRVNLRVGAIVTKGKHVLLCRMRDRNWWFLPGGRIQTGETSVDALKRELREEIGDFFHIIRPVVFAENFFRESDRNFHEFCTFYEVDWMGDADLQQSFAGEYEVFLWANLNDVFDMDIRPSFIKEFLVRPKNIFEHVIFNDGEQVPPPGNS